MLEAFGRKLKDDGLDPNTANVYLSENNWDYSKAVEIYESKKKWELEKKNLINKLKFKMTYKDRDEMMAQ